LILTALALYFNRRSTMEAAMVLEATVSVPAGGFALKTANDNGHPLPASFDEALAAFMSDAQRMIDEYHDKFFADARKRVNDDTFGAERLSLEPGRRYVRVVRRSVNGTSGSVYCFVDKTNGDILKAESFKKPAKHARGNIFSVRKASEACTPYGAHYIVR